MFDGIIGKPFSNQYSNFPAVYYDRWHQSDPYDPSSEWIAGKYPAVRSDNAFQGSNNYESSKQRINGSYLRLKNVELGYTFRNFKVKGVSGIRCYINLTNPLLFCNRDLMGFDPEGAHGSTADGFRYPLTRYYNLGVNLTF